MHTPQEGRDTVVGYLTAAFTVLGPGLAYEREWLGEDSAVLQFRTEVGGLQRLGHRHDHLGRRRAGSSTSP